MTTSSTRDRLTEALTEPMTALGLDLEAVDLSAAGKRSVLRVAVDKDGGVSMDDIAEATREVSRVLDDGDLMGERAYTLEVSSRGVDRPLALPRHWRRNVGRLVQVTFADPATEAVTGRLVSSDEDGAGLEVDGSPRRVLFDEVARAQVQIEFTKHEES
ncbi:ribosome maturation factor RimP [Nocardioides scoriae]|uniref:Ribosome maturation factor RimP n=1 Tax=Nocardioides scoriae TaxID=642780 RepID=A0A1H1L2V2_9ACTN|nr:ribosome maturation factor RimP [Nocardioides scoriae]SDR68823.1 ribosome maturation factor RimP [Nocardioides scoriae]